MKRIPAIVTLLALLGGNLTAAPVGTAITYQGRLTEGDNPAGGVFDLRFTVYDALAGGISVGGPVTNVATCVTNGLFTATPDFGADVFTGSALWLEIAVRTNGGGAFTALSPRQEFTPAPYALSAGSLSGTLPAAQLSGTVASNQIAGTYSSTVTFNNGANVFDGTFYGNFLGLNFIGGSFSGQFVGDGGSLINLNAAQLTGAVADARLSSNVPLLNRNQTYTGTNTFSGATVLTNAANSIAGNGAGLTNLNAASLSSGALPSSQLAGAYTSAVTLNNGGNNISGTFTGNGAGLTNLVLTTLGGLYATNFWQTGGNSNTTPTANFLGTKDNQPLELRVNGVRALRLEPNSASAPNVVGGSPRNLVNTGVVGGFIGGGGAVNYSGLPHTNRVFADFGVIGGGYDNTIQSGATLSFIGGGEQHTIHPNAYYSAIAGGSQNTIQIEAGYSFIGAGRLNTIQTNAYYSAIGGGLQNVIQADAYDSFIGGGTDNTIQTNAYESFIGGGSFNTIQTNAFDSFIGGGSYNTIQPNANHSFVGGGTRNTIMPRANYSCISGGSYNTIRSNAYYSFIGGGTQNAIQTNSHHSFIGGGNNITIQNNAEYSSVIGGGVNVIQSGASYSFIGGGSANTIQLEADSSSIIGGYANTIQTNTTYSFIGGGINNTIQTNASWSFIGGGYYNTILASASDSFIGGGDWNTNGGVYAVVPGGMYNFAGSLCSFAAGSRAKAVHSGAFVWSDTTGSDFSSSAEDQFNVRARGGVRIFSNGGMTAGVALASDATAWSTLCDRDAKKNFMPVDGLSVLEKLARVPVQQWNYQWETADTTPHLGPMAQDFKAAFYPGRDDRSITTLEFDGVELAAIQGLNRKLETKDAEIQTLQTDVAELKALVNRLLQQSSGGDQ